MVFGNESGSCLLKKPSRAEALKIEASGKEVKNSNDRNEWMKYDPNCKW